MSVVTKILHIYSIILKIFLEYNVIATSLICSIFSELIRSTKFIKRPKNPLRFYEYNFVTY